MRSDVSSDNAVLKFFCQHLVPFQIALRRGPEIRVAIYSAFVISIRGQWILMTAGHCIKEIEKAQAAGWEVSQAHFVDSLGFRAKFNQTLPFDWPGANATVLCRDETFDYGLIWIHDLERRGLEANGVKAIDEEAWFSPPSDPDAHALMGVPAELSAPSTGVSSIGTSLHFLEALSDPPEGFAKTSAPTFYARIRLDDQLTDIRGVSGGPVFALKKVEGRLKYWLLALQSRWLPQSKYIAAPLVRPVGVFLQEVMEGKHPDLVK